MLLRLSAFFAAALLFLACSAACIYMTGVTRTWEIVPKGTVLDLGPVGKGSVLLFNISTRERYLCPPWDNWDRAWAEHLPPGIVQKYTGWFQIYFHPFTLIITNATPCGSYTFPVCVQDQGTGIKECIYVHIVVQPPRPRITYRISRLFNTIVLKLYNRGNTWEICSISTNVPAAIHPASAYLPTKYAATFFIYPKIDKGTVIIRVNCTISRLIIKYNYSRLLAEAKPAVLELYPGQAANVTLYAEQGVKLQVLPSPLDVVLQFPLLEVYVPQNISPGTYYVKLLAKKGPRTETVKIKVVVRRRLPVYCKLLHLLILPAATNATVLQPFKLHVFVFNGDNENHTLQLTLETPQQVLARIPSNVTVPAEDKIAVMLEGVALQPGNYTIVVKVPACGISASAKIQAINPVARNVYVNASVQRQANKNASKASLNKTSTSVLPQASAVPPAVEFQPASVEIYPGTPSLQLRLVIAAPQHERCTCALFNKIIYVNNTYSLPIVINTAQYKTAGTYTYTLPVTCTCSGHKFSLRAQAKITILPVHGLDVLPAHVILRSPSGTFVLTIKNTGDVPEQLTVATTCNASLPSSIVLEPGESKQVAVHYWLAPGTRCEILFLGQGVQARVAVEVPAQHRSSKPKPFPLFAPFLWLLKYLGL
ncbi:MAG: hypothetical protein GXO42_00360 [bacterium]|nr:hypothetical protein [bacterium]